MFVFRKQTQTSRKCSCKYLSLIHIKYSFSLSFVQIDKLYAIKRFFVKTLNLEYHLHLLGH